MKKLFFLIISLILAIAVQATEFTVDNLKYTVLEDGTSVAVETVSGITYSGALVIPSSVTYGGKSYVVKQISRYGFYYKTSLTSIIIPSSVTTIDNNAFSGCTSLTSVEIPSSVTSIGESAFSGCRSLRSIVIPPNITSIAEGTFSSCGFNSITIPARVSSIASSAFNGSQLAQFIVADGNPYFSEIDGVLFTKNKETLVLYPSAKAGDSYVVPSTVKAIGYNAFVRSTISSVTMSPNLTFLEYGSFTYCTNLKKITFLTLTPPKVINGAFDILNTGDRLVYVPKSSLAAYDAALEIWKFCILESGAVNDYNVTLSKAGRLLNELGAANLRNVIRLKISGPMNGTDIQLIQTMIPALRKLDMENATIESGGSTYLTNENEIGYDMFQGLFLDSIYLPSTATKISTYAFNSKYYSNNFLSYVKLPSALTTIEDDAFSNCAHLSDIGELPSGLTYIGNNAFYRCPLTSVTIPGGVTTISPTAFQNCNLQSVTILPGVKSIGKSAFEGCYNLTALTIPSTVESIGESAFRSCSSLSSPVIPSSVKTIGNYAYAQCTSFTSITIPAIAKTTLGLFYGCTGVTSVAFEPGFTTIPAATFSDFTNLTSVDIPSTVTSIGGSAFSGCSSLQSIVLPSGVTSIGAYAFQGCSRFTSFTIPSAVTSIEASTFDNCSELATINMPSGITSIGAAAFRNCSKLASFTFPSGVTTIGASTFENCSTLTSIMLPVGITSIGSYAFRNCTGLTEFHVREEVPPVTYTDCFSGINKTACTLYTPIDCYAIYFLSSGWRYFQNMTEEDLSATPEDEMAPLALITMADGICIKGAEVGASITVFSANGAVLFTLKATGEEQFISLPSGVLYFVKVGEKTVKVAL